MKTFNKDCFRHNGKPIWSTELPECTCTPEQTLMRFLEEGVIKLNNFKDYESFLDEFKIYQKRELKDE